MSLAASSDYSNNSNYTNNSVSLLLTHLLSRFVSISPENNTEISNHSTLEPAFSLSSSTSQPLSAFFPFILHNNSNFTDHSSNHSNHSSSGHSSNHTCAYETRPCTKGMLLPPWLPPVHPGETGTIFFRAVVYLTALTYFLFGVNILSDRVVSAIEVIVAQKRKITMTSPSGQTMVIEVPIWHPVVATLTVYVIGSSAPEIFLPIIEIFRHSFEVDELGPALILGSGAYHLFLITGICMASVREPAGKPIRHMSVFMITTVFAIVAYLWIYLLVAQISPGVIELWEALSTLALFPTIVVAVWAIEKGFHREIVRKLARLTGNVSPGNAAKPADDPTEFGGDLGETVRRRKLAILLQELKATNPDKSQIELEEMAELNLLESAPKGVAFYRLQAAKSMSGGGNVISKEKIKKRLENELRSLHALAEVEEAVNPHAQLISFEPSHYTVMESCGDAVVTVHRSGYGLSSTVLTLDYITVEGTAKFGEDFEQKKGSLQFSPNQTSCEIFIPVIDDDEFEDDKEFYVEVSNPSIKAKKPKTPVTNNTNLFNSGGGGVSNGHASHHGNGHLSVVNNHNTPNEEPAAVTLAVPKIVVKRATVKILDDDHCGVFHFEAEDFPISDNCGTAKVKIIRSTGARGRTELPFKIVPGSAKPTDDYIPPDQNSVIFENDQFEAYIDIQITEKNRLNQVYTFYIELETPVILTKPPQNPDGNPILGDPPRIKVRLVEDVEMNAALDRLLRVANIAELIISTTWKDQFMEAIAFSSDESVPPPEPVPREPDENGEIWVPVVSPNYTAKRLKGILRKFRMYFVYGISLPWKLLAAAIPPARYLHGWLAFILLMALIAFLSSVIGDLATSFGCTVGLRDTVTAVTVVAFGMGLPDTFASRHAAIHELTADTAIGHITGSNAVNVFLGIGTAWSVAAIYHWFHHQALTLTPGILGFGVTLYCTFASFGVILLLLRRLPPIRGELGGPYLPKVASSLVFVLMWLTFVILLTLESYCLLGNF